VIEYTDGNILKADVEALVNPVNCIGVMGAGLALQFKRFHIGNYMLYKWACKDSRIKIGKVFTTEISETSPKYIVNFPTKNHWSGNSHIQDIEIGLLSLQKEIEVLSIQSIAIPALGCGLGGLQWQDVKPLVEKYMNIDGVRVMVYEPR
jgi:O-acetyl-ADP-ribose deacetylase (regulator of RNase III)